MRAEPGQQAYFLSQSSGSMPNVPSPSGTVVSPRRSAASRPRERCVWLAEVDLAVQLEPVDAGRDLELELARLAVQLPLGLDAPALGRQLGDDLRQL